MSGDCVSARCALEFVESGAGQAPLLHRVLPMVRCHRQSWGALASHAERTVDHDDVVTHCFLDGKVTGRLSWNGEPLRCLVCLFTQQRRSHRFPALLKA